MFGHKAMDARDLKHQSLSDRQCPDHKLPPRLINGVNLPFAAFFREARHSRQSVSPKWVRFRSGIRRERE